MLERLLPELLLPGRLLQGLVVSSFLYGCATFPESREATLPRPSQNGRVNIESLNRIFDRYGKSIAWAAAKHNIDAGLIAAVIRYESNGNSEAISDTGCTGLMQICAGSALQPVEYVCQQNRQLGPRECYFKKLPKEEREKRMEQGAGPFWYVPCRKNVGCVVDDRFYPWKNLEGGIKVLKGKIAHYRGKYDDYLRFSLAAYNAGPGIIDTGIKETGEKNPSWEKVYSKITLSTFRQFRDYNKRTDDEIERKIAALDNYVAKIYGVYWAYREQRELEQQEKTEGLVERTNGEENKDKDKDKEKNKREIGENGEVPVG